MLCVFLFFQQFPFKGSGSEELDDSIRQKGVVHYPEEISSNAQDCLCQVGYISLSTVSYFGQR